jgi:hypothetical protein
MLGPQILGLRLAAQKLTQSPFQTPLQAVAHLGAVQAQDFAGAKWAVAQRLDRATEADLDRAFNAGDILRTHVLRPTWHFVAPADIRWLLELTGERVLAAGRSQYRKLGLSDEIFRRAEDILRSALAGGNYLTRPECEVLFRQAGISLHTPPELGSLSSHLLMHAELFALVTSGPLRGKQHTYALLSERAPDAGTYTRPQALAELASRFFMSHGPATLADFAWWSGLTKADAKAGLAAVTAELSHAVVSDNQYWFDPRLTAEIAKNTVYLLPNYDEYIIAYANRSQMIGATPGHLLDGRGNVIFNNVIISDGRVVGTWRRKLQSRVVTVEALLFEPVTRGVAALLKQAAARYAVYLGAELDFILT